MLSKYRLLHLTGFLLSLSAHNLAAQDAPEEDVTVTYPADYFAQYGVVSVNDMLSRIPGIDLALGGNQVPRFGNNDRGLGATSQILINGKRLAGKANEASSQLDRIAAEQVDYIEIIRGNSGDLDVRNTGQLVNIVLLESQSNSSTSGELGFTHFHDGTVEPNGSFSFSSQSGSLTYLVSADVTSGYEYLESREASYLGDNTLNDIRDFDRVREQTTYRLNSNVVYQSSPADRIAFNFLYSESDPPAELFRSITDYQTPNAAVRYEREELPSTNESWELGGDYEHNFSNGGKYKFLFIVNERDRATTRESFVSSVLGGAETQDLYLDTSSKYQERIARTSYTWDITATQALELGVEGAQTIQNSALRLGLNVPGTPSPEFGGLTPIPVPNAFSEVEEVRFEGFAIHNWQINERMSLESSLFYETSEIEQSGDINKKRDFDFIKPKLDFRFDISNSFQLRVSAEKDVSQLSFADFSASVNQQDDDQNTIAGNPEIEQEQTWRYNINLDYRLPNDGGVLNSRFFYYDVGNSIGRVDATTDPNNLIGANGNVGDGKVFGLYLNASIRLGFLDMPQALITAAVNFEDAYIYDPLIEKTRTVIPFDRGGFRLGYRHDVPAQNLSFGLNYNDAFGDVGGTGGNRVRYDINNVVFFGAGKLRPTLDLFAEKVGYGGFTYRAEIKDLQNEVRCNQRKRYSGYLRDGNLIETENTCVNTGAQLVFKVRANF